MMVKGLMKTFDCVLPLAKVEEDEVHLPLAKLRKRIKKLGVPDWRRRRRSRQ